MDRESKSKSRSRCPKNHQTEPKGGVGGEERSGLKAHRHAARTPLILRERAQKLQRRRDRNWESKKKKRQYKEEEEVGGMDRQKENPPKKKIKKGKV